MIDPHRRFGIRTCLIVAMTVCPAMYLTEAAGTEQYQLKNGLTVILRPVQGAKQIALVTLYKFGEDSDPVGQAGIRADAAGLLSHDG